MNIPSSKPSPLSPSKEGLLQCGTLPHIQVSVRIIECSLTMIVVLVFVCGTCMNFRNSFISTVDYSELYMGMTISLFRKIGTELLIYEFSTRNFG